MSQHFAKLAQLKAKISSHGTDNPSKLYVAIEGRSVPLVLLFLLHAADISKPAKAAPIFMEWCDRCLEEFFAKATWKRRRAYRSLLCATGT